MPIAGGASSPTRIKSEAAGVIVMINALLLGNIILIKKKWQPRIQTLAHSLANEVNEFLRVDTYQKAREKCSMQNL